MTGTTKYLLIIFSIFFLPLENGQGQTGISESISEKFLRYAGIPREEIFVHTDREQYIAGEDVWLEVYLTQRQNNLLYSGSAIAYVELLNYNNRPVLRKTIKLEKGTGPGLMILPDTLSPGSYTLRAYTRWMRNFMPDNCFQKEINIYNAVSSQQFRKKSSSGKDFPDEAQIKTSMPDLSNVDLRINNLKADSLEIFIKSDKKFRSENNNLCFIFIQTHGIINYSATVALDGENSLKPIPKKLLMPGINHITVFDSKGKPAIERFIFTPAKESGILVVNSAERFQKRGKISLQLDLQNKDKNDYAIMSISVTPFAGKNCAMDMSDYMVFGSEFGTDILKKFKGKRISEISPAVMDSLLLTVRSSWINWEKILSGKLPEINFEPETNEHFLSGKLISTNGLETFPGKFIIMSVPGKEAVFQYSKTDKEGNFSFRLPIDEEVRKIIIQPDKNDGSVKIESSFSEEYSPNRNSDTYSSVSVPPNIPGWSRNYQVNRIYGSTFPIEAGKVISKKPMRFYGKPDIELMLDDYIKLPVMQEIFFELLPGVYLKSKKSLYEINVFDPLTNSFHKLPPSLFIDGVKIDDAGLIANLDPEAVEKIDVIKGKYVVGDYMFNGIVNVITKAGDFSSVNLPDHAVRMFYRVIDPVSSFFQPEYLTPEQKQSRIPDFRNTLFWDPSVKLEKDNGATIEFWSSDIVSDYVISIQGITGSGELISYKKLIKIE